MAAIGNDAVSRLVAEHATEMRGHADRAADIGTDLERAIAGGDRRGGAARRAARRHRGVPRIVGLAVDVVVALPVGERDRNVGLAHDDRAGGFASLYRAGVFRGAVVLFLGVAPGADQAGDVVGFFHR